MCLKVAAFRLTKMAQIYLLGISRTARREAWVSSFGFKLVLKTNQCTLVSGLRICLMAKEFFSTTQSRPFTKQSSSKEPSTRVKKLSSYIRMETSIKASCRKCKDIADLAGSSMLMEKAMKESGLMERGKAKGSS